MCAKPQLTVIEGGGESSGPTRAECDAAARQVIEGLTGGSGNVDSTSLEDVHRRLIRDYGFAFTDKNSFGVLPGGYQLFYGKYHVLVRIKTVGTQKRPRPHLTVSLTLGGPGWEQERAKYNSRGRPSPALLSKDPIGKMPGLARLNSDLTDAQQDRWANDCHFDFPEGFDDSAAPFLTPGS